MNDEIENRGPAHARGSGSCCWTAACELTTAGTEGRVPGRQGGGDGESRGKTASHPTPTFYPIVTFKSSFTFHAFAICHLPVCAHGAFDEGGSAISDSLTFTPLMILRAPNALQIPTEEAHRERRVVAQNPQWPVHRPKSGLWNQPPVKELGHWPCTQRVSDQAESQNNP